MEIQEKVALSNFTTLKVGGLAKYLIEVESVEDLKKAVAFVLEMQLPFMVLGCGSNILFSDDGYAGVVIKPNIRGREYRNEKVGGVTEVHLVVGAGEILDDLVAETVEKQYWGLENFSSIPGTVGATPVQNVGAYGSEVAEVIVSVEVFDTESGKIFWLTNEECKFAYRDSFFKTSLGEKFIIIQVHFKLSVEPVLKFRHEGKGFVFTERHPDPKEVREFVRQIRIGKFPDWQKVGTAGSFFKNPVIESREGEALKLKYPELPIFPVDDNNVKIPLGYVLDKICNLRGFRSGRVGLSEAQALVLINHGGATATEIIEFANLVSEKVFSLTNIKIEPEVRIISK